MYQPVPTPGTVVQLSSVSLTREHGAVASKTPPCPLPYCTVMGGSSVVLEYPNDVPCDRVAELAYGSGVSTLPPPEAA
jgi:hypothetical protein